MRLTNLHRLLLAVATAVVVSVVAGSQVRADEYDDCHGCRLHHHHHGWHDYRYIEGRDPWFNCGCNGSYKFPVPPLYTYHWPGMYSQVRMTDYHSPWRFPPIRPYVEDQPVAETAPQSSSLRVRLAR